MPDVDVEASVVPPPPCRKDSRNDLMTSNRASGFPSVGFAWMFLQPGLFIGGETSQGSHRHDTRSHRYGMKKTEARQ